MFGRRRIAAPSAQDDLGPTRVGSGVPPAPPARRRIRRPRGGLLSLMSGLLTIGVVIAGVLVFGLLALEHQVDKPGPLTADKVVVVPKNIGTPEISELLAHEGVIDNPTLFDLYALLKRGKGQLKAGEFLFRANVTIEEAIDTLIGGKAILHQLTIPEGLTSEQIVARMTDNDILTGTLNDAPREGSLMPDTYKFERGTTRQQLIIEMQRKSRDLLARTWEKRSPDLAIKTPQELVILASIVEKETGRADERPRVASVFLNRLQRRMKLQSDPTIVYGIVGGKGTLGRGITRAEIDRATPYNTYVIEGLPPGPIANPGKAALEAVANPLKSRDIYFVADGTGGHAFAETLDQHQRNVVRWRQLERSRDVAGQGAPVDRSAPPAGADTRTEFEAAPLPRSASADPGGSGRGFDASEGTGRDPLLNRNWDLSSPKTVPNLNGAPASDPAANPARTARKPARTPPRQAAQVEDGLPPGVRLPPR